MGPKTGSNRSFAVRDAARPWAAAVSPDPRTAWERRGGFERGGWRGVSGGVVEGGGRGRGGGAYSCIVCLSHFTNDYAPLSRRSTVPTPNRDNSNSWALITLFPYYMDTFVIILSSSCFAAFGHHLSPRIAIVFSLLAIVPNSSMSHSSISLFSSSTSRPSLYISHYPTMWVIFSIALPHGHPVHLPPPPGYR